MKLLQMNHSKYCLSLAPTFSYLSCRTQREVQRCRAVQSVPLIILQAKGIQDPCFNHSSRMNELTVLRYRLY